VMALPCRLVHALTAEPGRLAFKNETARREPMTVSGGKHPKKECVMNIRIVGAALVLALAAGPAMARNVASPGHLTRSLYCATIEPGNPFSPAYDYMAWSKWRQRGGWDSTGDDRCFRNPLYSPYGPYAPPAAY